MSAAKCPRCGHRPSNRRAIQKRQAVKVLLEYRHFWTYGLDDQVRSNLIWVLKKRKIYSSKTASGDIRIGELVDLAKERYLEESRNEKA